MLPNKPYAATQHFIVIGNPIAHSKSPAIHTQFAQQVGLDIRYNRQLCPDNAASFNAVVAAFFNGGGVGANVTVPFKQMAYQLCLAQGGLSAHAQMAGAVNTLMLKEGEVYGDNTDGQGLVNHLQQLRWPLQGTNVAILGAGGAARGVILPLIEAGIARLTVANRTATKATQLVAQFANACAPSHKAPHKAQLTAQALSELSGDFDIIINATSSGLSAEALPLHESLSGRYAYDMMYGRPLPFIEHFAAKGAQTSDGYGMLIGQAALSFERWTHAQVAAWQLL